MTKPGYGTFVEAVALQRPVIYVRRFKFADEPSLVDYLHQYGRAVQLSLEDFTEGRWETALRRAAALPMPTAPLPPMTGAEDAAKLLRKILQKIV